jgi:glutathione synthase/RimK-type ligase-like ATP-grasp enzyme
MSGAMPAPPKSPRATLALVSEDRYAYKTRGRHWYIDNILEEDAILSRALAPLGIATQRVSWSDPDVEWSSFDAALLRTTWDYFERLDEFSAWLARAAACTRVFNPPELLRWNLDKHYLRELEAAGVPTVPTVFVERGSEVTLAELLRTHDLDEAVFKPAVSGAARQTFRVDPFSAIAHEPRFAELLRSEAMLVQPFQASILSYGELSLVVIDGRVTHGVRKLAKPGDFRVQDDHGGTVGAHEPTPAQIEFAERAVACCDPKPVYARVDMVSEPYRGLAVMELELIEPELWFRRAPSAAQRLAETLARLL